MNPKLVEVLKDRSEAIRTRWSQLLHVEPVTTPLANPDVLEHLIDDALARIFLALARKRGHVPTSLIAAKIALPDCNCGKNPYRAFYIAGEQAFNEAVILAEVELAATDRCPSDLAAAVYAVRSLAAAEIESFCGVCSCRGAVAHCRHAHAA